jgi:hypothetical protein
MANEAQGYAERASIRVIVAAVVGVAGAVVTGMLGSWDYAPSVGWDCGATVFLAWTWTVVATMDAAGGPVQTRYATAGPGRKYCKPCCCRLPARTG